jgi:aerobic carbon-monoxide dehydrogenase large subunit
VIGHPVPRVEDRPLLTGRARFVDDVRLPGTLHAAFLRSPLAHGLLRSMDAAEARDLPGVAAVLTGVDLPLDMTPPITTPGARSPARPLLARERVRFAGEPVAVAIAESRYLAEDALEAVLADYDPLPAVTALDAATGPDALAIHPPGNVLYESELEAGAVDEAFAAAAVVVEATLRNPRVAAVPMEPRGVLAAPEGDGLAVWSSTQAPHQLRTFLAQVLAVDAASIRVVCPDVGGGFGQKAHCYPEEAVVAAAALRLGRPVRWTEDRSENLIASSHARDQVVRARAAADGEGRLLAIDADVSCDTGAYGVFPHGHVLEALGTPAMIPGPYRVPAYRARSRSVATNKCPEGAYRGVGLPVSTLVHEQLLDRIARRLGLDRAEVRLRNFVGPDDFPHTTLTHQRYDSGDYGRALRLALDAIGWEGFEAERERARNEGRAIGIGVGCYVEYTGMGSAVFQGRGMVGIAGHDGAFVRLDEDGGATVWTSLPAMGQGLATTFAQLAAMELGLAVDAVRVANPDTSVGGLTGTGTFASRSAISGGGAIAGACDILRSRLLGDAGELLEAAPEDLLLRDGAVHVVGAPGRGVSVGDVVSGSAGDRYAAGFSYDPPAVTYPYATHACAVEVDRDTGGVRLLRYAIAEDCGRVVNPAIVEGQVHGATAQGIGGALLEHVVYDPDGQPLTTSLLDYLLPGAGDLPRLDVRHLEIPAPGTANGAKGVGEGGCLGPPAAIAGAVADALGVEVTELPLTPERVQGLARS